MKTQCTTQYNSSLTWMEFEVTIGCDFHSSVTGLKKWNNVIIQILLLRLYIYANLFYYTLPCLFFYAATLCLIDTFCSFFFYYWKTVDMYIIYYTIIYPVVHRRSILTKSNIQKLWLVPFRNKNNTLWPNTFTFDALIPVKHYESMNFTSWNILYCSISTLV